MDTCFHVTIHVIDYNKRSMRILVEHFETWDVCGMFVIENDLHILGMRPLGTQRIRRKQLLHYVLDSSTGRQKSRAVMGSINGIEWDEIMYFKSRNILIGCGRKADLHGQIRNVLSEYSLTTETWSLEEMSVQWSRNYQVVDWTKNGRYLIIADLPRILVRDLKLKKEYEMQLPAAFRDCDFAF